MTGEGGSRSPEPSSQGGSTSPGPRPWEAPSPQQGQREGPTPRQAGRTHKGPLPWEEGTHLSTGTLLPEVPAGWVRVNPGSPRGDTKKALWCWEAYTSTGWGVGGSLPAGKTTPQWKD